MDSMSGCLDSPLTEQWETLMAIQYKRGYGPQYTVHGKTLSSPHLKRTWGIKVPVDEEPN